MRCNREQLLPGSEENGHTRDHAVLRDAECWLSEGGETSLSTLAVTLRHQKDYVLGVSAILQSKCQALGRTKDITEIDLS